MTVGDISTLLVWGVSAAAHLGLMHLYQERPITYRRPTIEVEEDDE